MKNRKTAFAVVVLFLLCINPAGAQMKNEFVDHAAGYTSKDYDRFLERAMKMDNTLNFHKMRLAYTKSTKYNPYNPDIADRKAMRKAYLNRDYKTALKEAHKLLKMFYLDVEAHMICALCYEKTGDMKNADFHQYMTKGLLGAILSTGNGQKPETAYAVLTPHEDYVVMNYLKLKPQSQHLIRKNKKVYDKFIVKSAKGDKTGEIFFDVTLPFRHLSITVKKAKDKKK